MKTLDLRNLSESEREAAINEAVAVMLGYVRATTSNLTDDDTPRYWKSKTGRIEVSEAYRITPLGKFGHQFHYAVWATSCDAVMPLLEKVRWEGGTNWAGCYGDDPTTAVGVCIYSDDDFEPVAFALAATFPIAACIALLRANGVEVLL